MDARHIFLQCVLAIIPLTGYVIGDGEFKACAGCKVRLPPCSMAVAALSGKGSAEISQAHAVTEDLCTAYGCVLVLLRSSAKSRPFLCCIYPRSSASLWCGVSGASVFTPFRLGVVVRWQPPVQDSLCPDCWQSSLQALLTNTVLASLDLFSIPVVLPAGKVLISSMQDPRTVMPRLWLDLLTPQGSGLPIHTTSSLQIPPRGTGPNLMPFFPHPTWLCGNISCSFSCIGFLLYSFTVLVFSLFSVRIVLYVDAFLMCLWGKVNSISSYSTILVPLYVLFKRCWLALCYISCGI